MKIEKAKYWVENNNGCVCGHMHRTYDAADKCRQKLLAWNRKEKTCSAKWYNSRIMEDKHHETNRDSTLDRATMGIGGGCVCLGRT